jgi:SAM-dependent methyltransferase
MACYVHPKSAADPSAGEHGRALDVAGESASAHLHWIGDLLLPHLGASVLEVGAGLGSVTQYLAAGRRYVATDVSDVYLNALRSRFASWPNVEVRRMDLRKLDLTETFDSTIMINLLEHIYNDVGALRGLKECLNPGGNCLIYVPALNSLYGPWDRDSGHYRRYSKRRLAAVVAQAGLQPVHLRYVNMFAVPAWVLFSSRLIDRGNPRRVGGSLRIWDRIGVPLTRAIEQRVSPPVGLNLFCVARKP